MGAFLIIIALLNGVYATVLAYADDAALALTGKQPLLNRCCIHYIITIVLFIVGCHVAAMP